MQTRHEIPVTDDEAVVAVHHEPGDVTTAEADATTEAETTAEGEAGSDTWIVFCHGFLSDKSGSYEERCQRAVDAGYHAVRFDFRGCGEADGAFVDQTLSAKIADLRAVLASVDPGRLVLFGSSFGAKVAFHTARELDDARPELVAVAGRAPVTDNHSFEDRRAAVEREGQVTFETGQSIDGRFFEDLAQYPFDDVVGDLDCPVLLVHGSADESVPIGDSFEAAAALETDVLLETVSGEGHRFSTAGERRLRTRLFDWLASLGAASSGR